jgi:hypothetical protein
MCFAPAKQPKVEQQEAEVPAPPPAPPAKTPDEAEVGSARRAEERRLFGPLGPIRGPRLRRDRSVTGGGTGAGGSGISL